ncbi:hypothetical protein N183_37645 [Sinorhizobium sp. Sb3]|nr:hypothetical protein N183_37645 [Sinorhizobium sp. Sb3]
MGALLSEMQNDPTTKLARLHRLDLVADFDDHAAIFMTHMSRPAHRLEPAVGPEIGTTNTGRR